MPEWDIFIYCCACAETAKIPLTAKFLTHNLKPPWPSFIRLRILMALSTRFMGLFSKKTAFVMQSFRNLGASGGRAGQITGLHVI